MDDIVTRARAYMQKHGGPKLPGGAGITLCHDWVPLDQPSIYDEVLE